MPAHSYEEIRQVVVDILLDVEHVTYEPTQFQNLVSGVAEVFGRRDESPASGTFVLRGAARSEDAELVRDVFWDLFRQGYITLGLNNSNPNWPFFRLSHFGQNTLAQSGPSRFHDTASYLGLVQQEIPDIGTEAVMYLEEAVAAFYADCLLSSTVMLGVASEAEFLRLVDVASNGPHGTAFARAGRDGLFIRKRITEFHTALGPMRSTLTPREHFEDIDTNLSMIQSVLRIARNEAGHPSGAPPPNREQVYVNLQMFIPLARQLMRLRTALS